MLGLWIRRTVGNTLCAVIDSLSSLEFLLGMQYSYVKYYGFDIIGQEQIPSHMSAFGAGMRKGFKKLRRRISGTSVFADLDGNSQYFYRTDADFPESGITGANDLTLQGWINVADVSGAKMIAGKFEVAGDKRMYWWYVAGNELVFAMSSDGDNNVTKTTAGVNLVANRWTHVAVVYDASAGTADFYKSGVFVEQETGYFNSIANKTPPFSVGIVSGSAAYFEGGLFNIALFDDKRTAGEILVSANNRNIDLSAEGNIIGQWMFNEDADAAFIDNTQGDAGRDLIPYDGGDIIFDTLRGTA